MWLIVPPTARNTGHLWPGEELQGLQHAGQGSGTCVRRALRGGVREKRDFMCNHPAAEDPLGAQLGQAERWLLQCKAASQESQSM